MERQDVADILALVKLLRKGLGTEVGADVPSVSVNVIVSPRNPQPGAWVGAPCVLRDNERFLLVWRVRRPRGDSGPEGDRGCALVIAESSDGVEFHEIWRLAKDEVLALSLERAALIRVGNEYRLFISYVDRESQQWVIDLIWAETIEKLHPENRTRIIQPGLGNVPAEVCGVKDPVIVQPVNSQDEWLLIASATWTDAEYNEGVNASDPRLYETGDAFATGLTQSRNAVFRSARGIDEWEWVEEAFPMGQTSAWDGFCSRPTAVLSLAAKGEDPEEKIGLLFYDGARSIDENYGERTGIATCRIQGRAKGDVLNASRLTPIEPLVPRSGARRYCSPIVDGDSLLVYYECESSNGSHDLRMVRLNAPRIVRC